MVLNTDLVNHPPHYNTGSIEVIDYLESSLGHQGFIDYCCGNVLKYTSRWRHKGGEEDLKKAQWYLNRVLVTIDKARKKEPIKEEYYADDPRPV